MSSAMLRAKSAIGIKAASVRSRKALTVRATSSATESEREAETLAYLKSLPGITAPFPDVFDPAGFAKTATAKDIKRWRESEITHGRVAMLASLGFLVGEQLEDFPAFLNFDGNITGPAIYQFQKVQQVRPGFWESLIVFIAIAESYRVGLGWATPTGTGFNSLKEEYEPGNLGFDPLNLKPTEPEALKEMQTKELNNGRLAMIAIAAFVVQELVSGTEVFEHTFLRIEEEVILELDDVERDLGLPITPVPELVLRELGQK